MNVSYITETLHCFLTVRFSSKPSADVSQLLWNILSLSFRLRSDSDGINCHFRESFTSTSTVTIQFIQAVGSSRTAYTYWSEDRLHVKAESNSSLLNYDMPFSQPFTAFCASFSFRQSLDQLISSFNLTELTLRPWQLNSSEHNVSEFHILELLTFDGLIIKCRECLQLSDCTENSREFQSLNFQV